MLIESTSIATTPESDAHFGTSVCTLENFNVCYNSLDEVLLVNWEGEATPADVRMGYEWVLTSVRQHRPRKILFDFHKRKRIRKADQQRVFREVFPEILRLVADDVFVAFVLPVTMYCGLVTDLNGDELMQGNNFLIIQHTLYREEAYRWLKSMTASSCLA